jgi:UDP-glucose 4-epimerase
MKTILVTGGGGFIGGWVIDELLRSGFKPMSFDHRQKCPIDGAEQFLGDVTSHEQVTEAMSHVDGWIHLAAVLGTQETVRNPRPAVFSNMTGGLNVLEAAAQYGVPGVYIGVGNHWMNNPYSISKTMIERFIAMFNKDRGTCVNIVRGMNAYGPRQRACHPFSTGRVRKIMPSFVCRALSGMPIEVYGDGNQVSDMVWVGDLARTLVAALVTAMDGKAVPTVECGPVVHATVNQVADFVARAAAGETGLAPVAVHHLPMRPGEIPGAKVMADTSTLAHVGVDKDLFVPLEQGVSATVRWFKENQGITWIRRG